MKSGIDNPYHHIEIICSSKYSKNDVQKLTHESKIIEKASEKIDNLINEFHLNIEKRSLLSILLIWSQWECRDRIVGERHLNMLAELMDEGIFPPKRSTTIKQFSQCNYNHIFSEI